MYANNRQTSIASLLKKEGYMTAFFHGGINGTMNFTDWSASAGYDLYFGRDEYNNDDDFDGFWGIWDEPFMQFAVKKMNRFKPPFHAALFTLSSHHPYFVPRQYKNKFKKGVLENAESVMYADNALRQFFARAKESPWFNQTLFVLVADHAGISGKEFYSNSVGNLSIPIVFYEPGHALEGVYTETFCQTDILPSVMHRLGYNKPFFAFGDSYLNGEDHHCIYYANATYNQYCDSMTYRYNNGKLVSVFNYVRDSTLSHDIVHANPYKDSVATIQFRSFIQAYNSALIGNACVLKNGSKK
jgi:phosphoglycerol transferase MdoB-like AlkP superfamily enzyme